MYIYTVRVCKFIPIVLFRGSLYFYVGVEEGTFSGIFSFRILTLG